MKKQLVYIIMISILISCKFTNKSNSFQGEIYVKLIDVRSLVSNLSDNELKKFKDGFKDGDKTNYSESEKKSSEYFKILIENNLLKKPFFKLKISSGKIINVYTTKVEFEELKKEIDILNKETEKIIVKFKGYKVSDGVFDSDGIFDQPIFISEKILSIKKTEGKTDWKK